MMPPKDPLEKKMTQAGLSKPDSTVRNFMRSSSGEVSENA
jgi:hypothetical protein